VTLNQLNAMDEADFTAVCGPIFEHSPWIAHRAWYRRPFASRSQLHQVMCQIVSSATSQQQLALIRAHPDLVGRLAREGRLTTQSTGEQAAAGLTQLSPAEAEQFDRYNAAYRARFGFPFVICARENKKQAVLAAFPVRLASDPAQEIATALEEIFKIARFRIADAITED